MKDKINIGLIGHKFMGKAHSHAYRDINMFFDLKSEVVRHTICGVESDIEEISKKYGFLNWETDWKAVVGNPEIDIIDICTPDNLHKEIAVAAAKAGKHVICEKPLSLNYDEAKEMLDAVRANHVKHMCNFTYRGLPAIKLAKEIIKSGRIGAVYSFKGFYLQDFSLSQDLPFVWRMDKSMAGAGIMADKGSHVIDMARYLVSEIDEVCAKTALYIKKRKSADTGELKNVTTKDAAVFLAGFENGALGVFELSNMCAGRKNALLLEINGSKGSIKFDLERLNELEVYFDGDDKKLSGFRTINVTESCHDYISHWWPSGHLIGWEHTFVHQIYEFIKAIEENGDNESNFYDGVKCQQVVDALAISDQKHGWVKVKDIGDDTIKL